MSESASRLAIDVEPGDTLVLGNDIRIEVQHKNGRLARLVVVAPRSIKINREKARDRDTARTAADAHA